MIVLCYSSFLKEFAHYLQQLYMESLGKEYTEKGFPKPEGQTVFGGVGTGTLLINFFKVNNMHLCNKYKKD